MYARSSCFRVAFAESLNTDLGEVREWCDHWGMKFNASKTIIFISRSRSMHPQSLALTLHDETLLKESVDLDILGVTFDYKMTFENYYYYYYYY